MLRAEEAAMMQREGESLTMARKCWSFKGFVSSKTSRTSPCKEELKRHLSKERPPLCSRISSLQVRGEGFAQPCWSPLCWQGNQGLMGSERGIPYRSLRHRTHNQVSISAVTIIYLRLSIANVLSTWDQIC
ncbi:hypothetical protein CEXT_114471 [Caerostris extrusa]|uniref:Uncharacterized protein n=1 Tax=Caerostris extrusa TaxID=172846 RepID=A0AAV4R6Q0_CAEEX|nr:hypothetical protein CEXT_114471 [Caerostris extrusa]